MIDEKSDAQVTNTITSRIIRVSVAVVTGVAVVVVVVVAIEVVDDIIIVIVVIVVVIVNEVVVRRAAQETKTTVVVAGIDRGDARVKVIVVVTMTMTSIVIIINENTMITTTTAMTIGNERTIRMADRVVPHLLHHRLSLSRTIGLQTMLYQRL